VFSRFRPEVFHADTTTARSEGTRAGEAPKGALCSKITPRTPTLRSDPRGRHRTTASPSKRAPRPWRGRSRRCGQRRRPLGSC